MVAVPSSHIRTRSEPRISANELARYMVTPEPGRLGIIRRARESATPLRIRYAELRSGIAAFLADFRRPLGVLHELQASLEQRRDDPRESEFGRQDAISSLAALDAFMLMQNQLNGYRFISSPPTSPLAMGGVNVSIHLDLLALGERVGDNRCGGVLFRLTKADDGETDSAASKRRDMGAYAATLAMMQARSLDALPAVVHHDFCMSIDVQCREVHTASRNFATRAARLEAACRFIAAIWPSA